MTTLGRNRTHIGEKNPAFRRRYLTQHRFLLRISNKIGWIRAGLPPHARCVSRLSKLPINGGTRPVVPALDRTLLSIPRLSHRKHDFRIHKNDSVGGRPGIVNASVPSGACLGHFWATNDKDCRFTPIWCGGRGEGVKREHRFNELRTRCGRGKIGMSFAFNS